MINHNLDDIQTIQPLENDCELDILECEAADKPDGEARHVKWSELLQKISRTIRTAETVEEYQSWKHDTDKKVRAKADRAKDRGGFVGGTFSNNHRGKDAALTRDLVTLDIDSGVISPSDIERANLKIAWAIYTTHTHLPQKPRFRMIIPINGSIPANKYDALVHAIGQTLAEFLHKDPAEIFTDQSTYRPSQLMYWPTTPKNGDFVFRYHDGKIYDGMFWSAIIEKWLQSSKQGKPKQKKPAASVQKGVERVPVGERHNYVIHTIGRIVSNLGTDLSDDAILAAVVADYQDKAEGLEDFDEEHFKKTYRPWVQKYAAAARELGTDFWSEAVRAWEEENPGKVFDADNPGAWDEVKEAGIRAKAEGKKEVPDDREKIREALKPADYTDVGQSRVFIRFYGQLLRYSTATKWLVYDGQKWNESELKARRLAQRLTDTQLKESRRELKEARGKLDTASESGDKMQQQEAKAEVTAATVFRQYVLSERKTNKITAFLCEAQPAVEIGVTDLDRDPFLLNTPAGTVDLRTGELLPHKPEDYITKMTAVSPSNEGVDVWHSFLYQVTCGDKDLQEYHKHVGGMILVGRVFIEKMIIATGGGGNGKSTFYNAQAYCLGDYAGNIAADTLITQKNRNIMPDLAKLRGKRMIISAELEEGRRLDTGTVKQMTSTDKISARNLYKDPFEFVPSHTLILYTNHLPKVGSKDRGTWDRLVVVPFNARFRGQKGEILNYAQYLYEHAGGAILSWMIEGAKEYIAAGYHIEEPDSVKEAIAAYREQNDWFNHFIDDRCEVDRTFRVGAGALYENYRDYCESVGEFTRSSSELKTEMENNGYSWKKTNSGAVYLGLRLKSDFEKFTGETPFDHEPEKR